MFSSSDAMKGPETATCTPLPRAEKEAQLGRTQRFAHSSEDVPDKEQERSFLPCTKLGAVITSGSIECYPSKP